MTYFAIGESTGGAGERRLGPFETPEEAAQAGRKETRESNGGFVFRGVVDEANNQVGFDIEPIVSTNSVVRNAMAVKNRVARNESLEYKIVIDLPNRQEVVSPLFSSEWAATVRAKDIAAKTGEKVRVVHRPTGNVVWKNAVAANRRVARNANDDSATARKYIRECLDAIYGADDSRKRALSSIASLINGGALDKSVGSKVNELQSHLEKAMVLGKEIFYQHLSK